MSYKTKISLIILGLFILTIAFFWFFIFDTASMGNDGCGLWYPNLSFVLSSFRSGQLPFWNPYDFSGRPCAGDTFAGVFYPLFWPLVLFVKGGILSFLAMEYNAIFHVFLTGVFMYFFARAIHLGSFGCLVSAVTYMFCGNMFGFFDSPPQVALTWLPFILLFLQKSIDRKDFLYVILGGVGVAMSGLFMHPQFHLYLLYTVGFYFLFIFLQKKRMKESNTELLFAIKLFLVLMFIGFALSAVQIIPAWELNLNSTRESISWNQSVYNSMNPKRLLGFLIPYFFVEPRQAMMDPGFEEYHMYIGILPLFLSWVGIVFSRHPKKKFFILLFLISLLYALGKFTPVQPIFYYLVPGFNKVRASTRISWIYDFGLAVLAGMGIDALLESKKSELKNRIYLFFRIILKVAFILLSLMVLATIFWVVWMMGIDFSKIGDLACTRIFKNTYIFLCFLFLSLGLLRLFLISKVKPVTFQLLSLSLILLDLFIIQTQIHSYKKIRSWERFPEVGRMQFLKQDPTLFRVLTEYGDYESRDPVLRNNWGSVYRICNAWGYAPMTLRRLQDLSAIHNENLLLLLNIKYILTKENSFPDSDLVFMEDDVHVFRLRNILPRVFFVRKCLILENSDQVLNFISSPDFNPRETVVLEERLENRMDDSPNGKETELPLVRVEKYLNNSIDVSVKNGSEGFLVFSEVYYPGWSSTVDGKSEKIYKANYAFRAVPLKKGSHRISMIYKPSSVYCGVFISLAALCAVICYVFFRLVRKPGEKHGQA